MSECKSWGGTIWFGIAFTLFLITWAVLPAIRRCEQRLISIQLEMGIDTTTTDQ